MKGRFVVYQGGTWYALLYSDSSLNGAVPTQPTSDDMVVQRMSEKGWLKSVESKGLAIDPSQSFGDIKILREKAS